MEEVPAVDPDVVKIEPEVKVEEGATDAAAGGEENMDTEEQTTTGSLHITWAILYTWRMFRGLDIVISLVFFSHFY